MSVDTSHTYLHCYLATGCKPTNNLAIFLGSELASWVTQTACQHIIDSKTREIRNDVCCVPQVAFAVQGTCRFDWHIACHRHGASHLICKQTVRHVISAGAAVTALQRSRDTFDGMYSPVGHLLSLSCGRVLGGPYP